MRRVAARLAGRWRIFCAATPVSSRPRKVCVYHGGRATVNPTAKILVVDDHVHLAENIAEILENAGYETMVAASAEEALDAPDVASVNALNHRLPPAWPERR